MPDAVSVASDHNPATVLYLAPDFPGKVTVVHVLGEHGVPKLMCEGQKLWPRFL
jgi:hypothetical protein